MNVLAKNRAIFPVLRVLAVLLILSLSIAVSAQRILPGSQVGSIQELQQDRDKVIISGRTLTWDSEIITVVLDGEVLTHPVLEPGMVVRYTVDNRGTITHLEILGPFDKINDRDEH